MDEAQARVADAEVVTDLVDQHMGDDRTQRLIMLGPIVENGAAVEEDSIGQLTGLGHGAVLGQPDAGKQSHQLERAFHAEAFEHVVSSLGCEAGSIFFLDDNLLNVEAAHAAGMQGALVRGIESGAMVRIFNERGEYRCKAEVSRRARPGVVNGLGIWWRKLGLAGTNVNQLTSQRLTDLGRAPVFYDCLVEVRPA